MFWKLDLFLSSCEGREDNYSVGSLRKSSKVQQRSLILSTVYVCILGRSQVMWFLYPSTQRHYRRLILLLILLSVSVVRPSSGRNMVNYILKTILILGVCVLLRVRDQVM
jgi:hypothetical protein